MTEYRTREGKRLTVCDECGIAADGSRPDIATLQKWDHTAELIAQGWPADTKLEVTDHCPTCTAVRDLRLPKPARVH